MARTPSMWFYKEDGLPSRGRNYTVFARLWDDRRGFVETELASGIFEEDDARIMAAGPKLLAALETLLNATDDIKDLEGCVERLIARDAIAEATGRPLTECGRSR